VFRRRDRRVGRGAVRERLARLRRKETVEV
jgi:hypothetical protein